VFVTEKKEKIFDVDDKKKRDLYGSMLENKC